MVRFAGIFPDAWIVNALRAQLSRTGNFELDQAVEAAGVDGNDKQGKLSNRWLCSCRMRKIYDRGGVASHGYRRFLRVLSDSVFFPFVPECLDAETETNC